MKVFKNVLSCEQSMEKLMKWCTVVFVFVGTPLLLKITGTVNNFKAVIIYTAISILVPVTFGCLMFLFFVCKESLRLNKK